MPSSSSPATKHATGGTGGRSFGSAPTLSSMGDVDLATTPPGAGDTLIWNPVDSKWAPTGLALANLNDVILTGNADNQVIKYDAKANAWKNWTPDYLNPTNGYTKTEIDGKLGSVVLGIEHEASVLTRSDIPPTNPVLGDTHIVGVTPTGIWVGNNNFIARWNGTAWDFTAPRANESHLIEDVAETWHWNGTNWVKVAVAQAAATSTGELWQVGSVQQSLLTETQWAAALGPEAAKWVLADGRNVAGSKYATLTGSTNVPDMRGAFIRSAGQNGNSSTAWNGKAVGTFHDFTTGLPKTAFTTSNPGNHTHPESIGIISGGDQTTQTWATSNIKSGSVNTGAGGAHTHTISGGDVETAPSHFSLNFYIKIN